MKVAHGGVVASALAAGLKVQSEGDEVELRRIRGPVEVKALRGEVTLVPDGPLTEAVSIETTHGAIRLDVPSGSRFELDASAHHGELVVDLPGVAEVKHGATRPHCAPRWEAAATACSSVPRAAT